MILDELNVFGRAIVPTEQGKESDILDWGTSGNALGTKVGAGHHGDDTLRGLSWHAQVMKPSTAPLTVAWETADNPNFSDKVLLVTKTLTGTPAAGDKIVDGEPLPKGLKRYQRIVVTGGGGGEVFAFVCDAQHA